MYTETPLRGSRDKNQEFETGKEKAIDTFFKETPITGPPVSLKGPAISV